MPEDTPGTAHQPKRRTTDTRVLRSKTLVIQVTLELLSEHGLGGLSIDDVARRSGVAKTTIYRHWPTRSDLILDACAQLSAQQAVPDTGSLNGDLTALLASLAAQLRTARWSSVMPSIIDAAERDPEIALVHSNIQREHAAPVLAVLTRATQNGELPPDTDHQAIIAALLGPLYYRRWFSREPLDEHFLHAMITRALNRTADVQAPDS